MNPLSTTLETIQHSERRSALRQLLRCPLTLAFEDADVFACIVRHRDWLARWFLEQPGWKLVVNPRGGFARLHKVPAEPDTTHPARVSGKPPFDRRRYVLLCLTLAALDETSTQTTIKRIAELLGNLSRDDGAAFNPSLFSERRAFVDVLRWLVEHGVLRVRDGDAERWVQDREGDALYDVDERILGQLVAAPVPPALADGPADILREQYPETEEGERLQPRHRVFRKLLDDPVVYYEDLSAREREWLDHSRGFVYTRLAEDAGLHVEKRREGLAGLDPDGEVTDTLFPDGGSTVKHAALLLAERLTDRARSNPADPEVHQSEVVAWTAALQADYGERCHWSRQYTPEDEGVRRLAADALELLQSFRLVRRTATGWRACAALARFAPAAPQAGVP